MSFGHQHENLVPVAEPHGPQQSYGVIEPLRRAVCGTCIVVGQFRGGAA